MNKKYHLNPFSQNSIAELQKSLRAYSNSLTYKAQMLAERLAQIGVERARVHVADLDAILSGELIASIHFEYNGSVPNGAVFVIKADSDHAAFVEFGTLGSIGGKKEYPYPLPTTWEYGIGEHIQTLPSGKVGWFYPTDDGQVRWCSGMDSRPFMYLTGLDISREVEKVAKEIFN